MLQVSIAFCVSLHWWMELCVAAPQCWDSGFFYLVLFSITWSKMAALALAINFAFPPI